MMDDGWSMFYATTAAEAIDSKLPLRPPRALNCGMALKRQETDHGKRKTKVPGCATVVGTWLTRSLPVVMSMSLDDGAPQPSPNGDNNIMQYIE